MNLHWKDWFWSWSFNTDAMNRFTGKDPDAGEDWGQEEKGTIEDGMVGWYHKLNGHEFEQTQGDSEGQRSLAKSWTWLSDWTTSTIIPSDITPVSPVFLLESYISVSLNLKDRISLLGSFATDTGSQYQVEIQRDEVKFYRRELICVTKILFLCFYRLLWSRTMEPLSKSQAVGSKVGTNNLKFSTLIWLCLLSPLIISSNFFR